MQSLTVQEMNHLRCQHCKNFLTCGVMLVLRNGGTLCGRCCAPKYNGSPRAYTFEHVISCLRLPCRYWLRHCKELLYTDQVLLHEEACIYKNRCDMLCGDFGAAFKSEKTVSNRNPVIRLLNIPPQALQWLICHQCNLYLSGACIYVNREGRPFCFRCLYDPNPDDYIRHKDLERLLTFMVFPCIYHLRGCAKRYRFGAQEGQMHEAECPYGLAAQRPISQYNKYNGKQRGVVQTHSGHVFATITPNTIQLFANNNNNNNNNRNSAGNNIGQSALMQNLQQVQLKKVAAVSNKLEQTVMEDQLDEGVPDAQQILDVSTLEGIHARGSLDELRNSFRNHVQQAPLPPPPPPILAPLNLRSYTAPEPLQRVYNENVPISPVFIQPTTPSPSYYQKVHPRRPESIMKELPVGVHHHNNAYSSNNQQSLGSLAGASVLSYQREVLEEFEVDDEPISDDFLQYGLPHGNVNLTHGVQQPNMVSSLERNSGPFGYNDIMSELKLRQRMVDQ